MIFVKEMLTGMHFCAFDTVQNQNSEKNQAFLLNLKEKTTKKLMRFIFRSFKAQIQNPNLNCYDNLVKVFSLEFLEPQK